MAKPGAMTTGARRGLLGRASARLGLGHADLEYQAPLSTSEARAVLDQRARANFGISGDEFVRRLRAGELPDTSVAHGLAMLAGEVLSQARPR